MNKRTGYIALAVSLLSGSVCSAQADLDRFERQLEQIRRDTRLRGNDQIPIGQRTFLDYGAFTTLNYLSLDDPNLDNRGLRQYDFSAYARVNIDGVHELFLRGRTFYRDFNTGDAFDEDGDGWDARLERAFYRFDLGRYLSSTRGQEAPAEFSVKVGRDLVLWANGLTLSQELDGAMVDFEYGPVRLGFIAGITPLDTVDIDSSRPNFDDHTKRGFYGAIASVRAGAHRPFAYVLVQRDYNVETAVQQFDLFTITTDFEYNSNYFGLGSSGALTDRLSYGVEFVYQSGTTLSNSFILDGGGLPNPIEQDTDTIQAWALDLQMDYALPDEQRTRLSGEMILASGDPDRLVTSNTFGGNRGGTRDHAFNAFGLVNTGLAFAPSVSNLIAVRGGVSLFPMPQVRAFRQLQVGTDLFLFAKLQEDAPIDEPTTDERFLGFEPDVYLNWQITSDVSLALRYGAFIPGDAIVNDDKIRQFFYAGVTFAF